MRRARSALAWVALVLSPWLAPAPASADRREDLEVLRKAIQESRERVADYEREERGLLETVEAMDRAAALLAGDVAHAQRAAGAAEQELLRLEAEAERLAGRLAATERALSARAVALYRAGELGSTRLLFSADSLPDFLSRVSALRRLLEHDATLLERRRAESQALELAREGARDSASRLAAAQAQLAQRSSELADERARKRRVVARLHGDRTRERAALVELEKAARALEETLESMGDAARDAGRPFEGPPFVALRRRLAPPVDAAIRRGFGRVVDEEFRTQTFQSGVVFEAPLGTPVEAVAAGRVRFAGWFRGYGRMVILDHGDGYFSVSGHLDEVDVEVGQTVGARQQLGRVGETGSLAGPQLYFEIRRGAEALDPADWLEGAAGG